MPDAAQAPAISRSPDSEKEVHQAEPEPEFIDPSPRRRRRTSSRIKAGWLIPKSALIVILIFVIVIVLTLALLMGVHAWFAMPH